MFLSCGYSLIRFIGKTELSEILEHVESVCFSHAVKPAARRERADLFIVSDRICSDSIKPGMCPWFDKTLSNLIAPRGGFVGMAEKWDLTLVLYQCLE